MADLCDSVSGKQGIFTIRNFYLSNKYNDTSDKTLVLNFKFTNKEILLQ